MRWSSHTSFPGFHCGLDSRGRVCLCVLGRDPPPIFTSLSFSPSKLIGLHSLIRSLFYSSAWCCLSNSSLSFYLLFLFFFSSLPQHSLPVPRGPSIRYEPTLSQKKKVRTHTGARYQLYLNAVFGYLWRISLVISARERHIENQRTNDLDPTRRPRLNRGLIGRILVVSPPHVGVTDFLDRPTKRNFLST